jgi:putative tryptophan/tyrosine transport system substrate-binding protein
MGTKGGEGRMIGRRRLLVAFGASALAAAFGSFAQQQSKVWRVGFLALSGAPESIDKHFYGAFRVGMRELGYIEGKNLVIEWRFAETKAERLPQLALDLVNLQVDAIIAGSTPAATAAQKVTSSVPIIIATSIDPVGSGLVKDLAHPGGNITGLSNQSLDYGAKQVEILQAVVPKLARLAILLNPGNSAHAGVLKNVREAGLATKISVLPIEARSASDIESAFALMRSQRIQGLLVVRDGIFNQYANLIAMLSLKNRLPSIGGVQDYPEAGGLMSYGQSLEYFYRRSATYVDKILKGAKPGDLPIEQPTKFELVINLMTAKALGIKIPQSLLVRADKVIE